jgi:alpha-amylase/alpha-mannosidase (GH57 family)
MPRILCDKLKAVYPRGSKQAFGFSVENNEDRAIRGTPFFSLKTQDGKHQLHVVYDAVELAPGEKKSFQFEVKLDLPSGEALASFCFEGEETLCLEKPVYVASEGPPLYIAFVWHHHQAPQVYPDGKLKDEWAFVHVVKGEFYSYEGGPYKVHMSLHKKSTKFKDVDHFSPSLLEQWELFLEGKLHSEVASKEEIRSLLNSIREEASKGGIELLGSVYAHTVQGLLLREAKLYGLEEFVKKLLAWEIAVGLSVVERVLGRRPRGAWTPEMFWHMELVNLYTQLGVSYTVLCEQHFIKSGGDKEDIYQPYLVQDACSGKAIIVFFRDLALSNWISFKVDFKDPEEADDEARRFVIELAKRREQHPNGIVVIALDGENWMIMPSYRKYAPLFLEKIVDYVDQSSGLLLLTTLSEYLEKNPPKRVLNYLPTGSWVELTDKQWTGGVKDQLWKEAMETLTLAEAAYQLLGIEADKLLSDAESPLYKLFRALAIGLDSDFFWYGELTREQEFIRTWLAEARKIAEGILGAVEAEITEKTSNYALLELRNKNSLTVSLKVITGGKGYSSQSQVTIAPCTLVKVPVYLAGDSSSIKIASGKIVIAELTL